MQLSDGMSEFGIEDKKAHMQSVAVLIDELRNSDFEVWILHTCMCMYAYDILIICLHVCMCDCMSV